MNWKTKSRSLWSNYTALVCLFFLMGCSESSEKESRVAHLPYYDDPAFTPHWIQPNSDTLSNFHKIPGFNFTNQEGATITEADFEGKIYVADFFFTTCPGICPKMTENMTLVQAAFLDDDEVLLLSHSVTPEYDSTEVLQEYAEAKGVINDKWHLVTGDRQEIYDLGRKSYFVEEDLGRKKGPDDFLHTENFVLIDQDKHIRGIYNGLNKTSVNQLIADVKTLRKKDL